MAINFPSSPSLNQQYTVGTRTWVWNGVAWKLSGSIGTSGFSGFSGYSGYSGMSGYSGISGYSGYSGILPSWLIKNSNYTASNYDRIIADTSAGGFTITLPSSPSMGTYIIITDGADWSVNELIVDPNGSSIEGFSDTLIVNIKGVTVELIYNGTWQVTATTGRQGVSGYSGYSGATSNVVYDAGTPSTDFSVGFNINCGGVV